MSGPRPTFLLVERDVPSGAVWCTRLGMESSLTARIREVAESVAALEGLEVVEAELLGGGKSRLLRITIDKPEGVTLQDCEFMSHQLGTVLDVEDVVPGGRYNLEVTSPGVERKLFRPKDFVRFVDQKVKVVLKTPIEGRKTFEGFLRGAAPGRIALEVSDALTLDIRLDEIARANLKFDWR